MIFAYNNPINEIVKIESAFLEKAVSPAHIAGFRDPAEKDNNGTDRSVQELVILVDRFDQIMIDAVRRIDGVTDEIRR